MSSPSAVSSALKSSVTLSLTQFPFDEFTIVGAPGFVLSIFILVLLDDELFPNESVAFI